MLGLNRRVASVKVQIVVEMIFEARVRGVEGEQILGGEPVETSDPSDELTGLQRVRPEPNDPNYKSNCIRALGCVR